MWSVIGIYSCMQVMTTITKVDSFWSISVSCLPRILEQSCCLHADYMWLLFVVWDMGGWGGGTYMAYYRMSWYMHIGTEWENLWLKLLVSIINIFVLNGAENGLKVFTQISQINPHPDLTSIEEWNALRSFSPWVIIIIVWLLELGVRWMHTQSYTYCIPCT